MNDARICFDELMRLDYGLLRSLIKLLAHEGTGKSEELHARRNYDSITLMKDGLKIVDYAWYDEKAYFVPRSCLEMFIETLSEKAGVNVVDAYIAFEEKSEKNHARHFKLFLSEVGLDSVMDPVLLERFNYFYYRELPKISGYPIGYPDILIC